MSYIEREAFVESQHNIYCVNCDRRKNSKGKFVYDIGDAPCRACDICDVLDAVEDFPAADVRPVVLCRDCKHWEKYDNTAGCGYCNKVKFEYGQIGYVFKPVREPVFFCAAGEKREES